jgi:type II secretory pathway component PulJ
MTLFEIMIVILVLSIISVMMFRILVVNSRENQKILSQIERVRSLHLGIEALLKDVQSAVPYAQDGKVLFQVRDGKEGTVDSDQITVVIPVRERDGSISLLERAYYLQRELRKDKVVWSLAWAHDASLDGTVEQIRGHVVTPLTGMQSVSFDVKVSPPGDNSWQDQWESRDSLPEKVRILLRAVDPGDPEHPVEVMETVYLMAG